MRCELASMVRRTSALEGLREKWGSRGPAPQKRPCRQEPALSVGTQVTHAQATAAPGRGWQTHLGRAPVVRGVVQRPGNGRVMRQGRVLALHGVRMLVAIAPVVIASRVPGRDRVSHSGENERARHLQAQPPGFLSHGDGLFVFFLCPPSLCTLESYCLRRCAKAWSCQDFVGVTGTEHRAPVGGQLRKGQQMRVDTEGPSRDCRKQGSGAHGPVLRGQPWADFPSAQLPGPSEWSLELSRTEP